MSTPTKDVFSVVMMRRTDAIPSYKQYVLISV